ncbi:membrane lipoprotein [Francisella frigiditurris]|uniref:Putative membrane protein n=1 Tax=Francisella frigiditurris TaxID=1542390 RepID=A0A1J0KTD9_9GAMM|nr:membrane lipoprotein [Francisella frigiditurris]APC96951.1 putative membrane protein [Francisella frigiditurris]
MHKHLNKVFIAYMAGLISALILVYIFTFIAKQQIPVSEDFKFKLYRLMVWGGVWGILLALPLSKNIWVKGSIVGLAVIFFNFLVKMPLSGQGFFALNAGTEVFLMNIIFNYLWGLLAAVIYAKVAKG